MAYRGRHVGTSSLVVVGLLLLFASATLVVNRKLGGSLVSQAELAKELTIQRGVPLPHYTLPPFRYRLLFRSMVDAVQAPLSALLGSPQPGEVSSLTRVSMASPPSLALYVGWLLVSAATFVLAPVTLWLFLRQLGFSIPCAFLGAVLWLLTPPALFAFVRPVHTRDDMLAQSLLTLGLVGMFAGYYWVVAVCTVLGVLTRESLLLLPIVSFFWRGFSLWHSGGLLTVGIVTAVAVRWILPWDSYPAIEWGLQYNLAHPLETHRR